MAWRYNIPAKQGSDLTVNWFLKNEDGTLNGQSECAFSGLQDAPFDPGSVQSWGIMPKATRDALRAFLLATVGIDIHPGTSCNPKKQGDLEP